MTKTTMIPEEPYCESCDGYGCDNELDLLCPDCNGTGMRDTKVRAIIIDSIGKTELRLLELMRKYDPLATLNLDDPFRVCPEDDWPTIIELDAEIQQLSTAYGETFSN
tara:strand:- start:200 stop:523 length:324 start_codon:yes stop_codon:yes gene_type:complete